MNYTCSDFERDVIAVLVSHGWTVRLLTPKFEGNHVLLAEKEIRGGRFTRAWEMEGPLFTNPNLRTDDGRLDEDLFLALVESDVEHFMEE